MGGIVKAVGDFVGDAIEDVFGAFGDVLDFVGLDSLGKEVERWGEDINQVTKVLSGQYHADAKKIQKMQDAVEAKQIEYKGQVDLLIEKIDSLIAFPEIFQMAAANRIDQLDALYGPELAALIKELESAMAKLKSDYDFVISLTEGGFIQRLIGSIIMIVGGINNDLGEILSGKADSSTWQRVITVVVLVIIIVLMWWNPLGWEAIGALSTLTLVMVTIGAFLTLDSMYANSAAMGGVMSCLDYIFNDMLNLDELIGSDFEKFDKDHEDYAQMVLYTRLGFTIATMIAAWGTSAPVAPVAPAQQAGTTVTQSFGGAVKTTTTTTATTSATGTVSYATNVSTTIFGISTSTYSSIYKAYSAAMSVGDMLNAKKAYEAMNDKFAEDKAKLDTLIDNKYRKNFMKHYKDTAYFLQDQQEYIDRYVWGMTAESMYVDPYGTTPVANTRFTPDKDTRVMSFGFEDMFDESSSAGSRGYFNSIIYGN